VRVGRGQRERPQLACPSGVVKKVREHATALLPTLDVNAVKALVAQHDSVLRGASTSANQSAARAADASMALALPVDNDSGVCVSATLTVTSDARVSLRLNLVAADVLLSIVTATAAELADVYMQHDEHGPSIYCEPPPGYFRAPPFAVSHTVTLEDLAGSHAGELDAWLTAMDQEMVASTGERGSD
jgi:hypothetical protein